MNDDTANPAGAAGRQNQEAPVPWRRVFKPVLAQLSDLFGARLAAGPITEARGLWPELRPHVPGNITAVVAALGGRVQGEIGLLWFLSDSGTSGQWTENQDAQAGLWDTICPGMASGLSEAIGAPVTIAARMEPQTGTADMLQGEEEPAVLVHLEAAGDGITIYLGLVVSNQVAAEVAGTGKPAHEAARPPAAPQASGEEEKLPTRYPRLNTLHPGSASAATREIDVVLDLPLRLTVEVGRAQVLLKEVLALGKGSVVPLDRLAGDLVDIHVNGKMIAKGEVVVLPHGNFGVRVAEVASSTDRLRNLQVQEG